MKFSNPFRPQPAPPGFGAGKIIPEDTAPYVTVRCLPCLYQRSARLFSRLIFEWLSPFLGVGFSRPLEKEGMMCIISLYHTDVSIDFWELPKPQLTGSITDQVERHFYARCPPDKRPRHLSHQFTDEHQYTPNDDIDVEKGHDDLDLKQTDSHASATAAPTPVESEEAVEKPSQQKSHHTKHGLFGRGKKSKPTYDQSLFKAIVRTFNYRICLAGVLKLSSGEF